jgi:hypothetical protein
VPEELIRSVGGIDIPHMSTGGSAVHGAIQTAILIGCRTIYLAGTDFGFPANRLYASGAGTGDEFTVSDDGQTYKRQPLDSHYRGGELFPTLANDGNTIGASVEMIQFREWTEGRIKRTENFDQPLHFFNLCYHGAVINGAPYTDDIDLSRLENSTKPDIRALSLSSKTVATLTTKAIRSRLHTRAGRLRKDKSQRHSDWTVDLKKMIKHASRCIEVSTLITAQLIKLNEYTSRIGTVNQVEADTLILKLVKEAKNAANELIPIYIRVTSPSRKLKSS